MATKLLFRSKFLTVYRMEIGTKKYTSFNWFNMSAPLEHVEAAHDWALKDAKENNISTYVARSEDATGVLRPDVITWWGGWIPKMKAGGINKIITVAKPVDDKGRPLSEINKRSWQKSVNYGGIENVNIEHPGDVLKNI